MWCSKRGRAGLFPAALCELCHNPWSFIHSCRTLSWPTILRPWPRQTAPSQRGSGALVRAPYSAWNSSIKFCSGLLEGRGPRLRRWGRMEGWSIIFFILGWCTESLTSWFQGETRAENKIWMAKMCMVRLITSASCLLRVLSSELPLFCSEPDRCNALPQVFWMLCNQCPKTVNVLIWKMQRCLSALSKKTYGSPTDKACVHLTVTSDFSSISVFQHLVPLSSSSHFPASPMLFEDDGGIGHIPPAKSAKLEDAQTCPSANPTQCSFVVLISGKQATAFLLWTAKGKLFLPTQVPSHLVLVQTHLCLHALVHTFLHNSWWKGVLGAARAGLCHQHSKSIWSSWHMGAEN